MGDVETIVEQSTEREGSVYQFGERVRVGENKEGLEINKSGQFINLSTLFGGSKMFEIYIRARDEEGENICLLNSQGRFVNGAKSFREQEIIDTHFDTNFLAEGYFDKNEKKKEKNIPAVLTIGKRIPILFGDKKIEEVVFVRDAQKVYQDPEKRFGGLRVNNIKEDFAKYFQYPRNKPNKKLPVGLFKYSSLKENYPFVSDFASLSRKEKEKRLQEIKKLADDNVYTFHPSKLNEGIEGVKQVQKEFSGAQKNLQKYSEFLKDVSSEQRIAFWEIWEDKLSPNLLHLSEFLAMGKTDDYGEALKNLNEEMSAVFQEISENRKDTMIESQGKNIKKAYDFLCKRYPVFLDSLDFRLDISSRRPCCRSIWEGHVIELPGENAEFFYQSHEDRHPIAIKMMCDWLNISKEKFFENNAELLRTFVFLHEVGHAHHKFYNPKDFQKAGYKSQDDIFELFLKEYNNGLLPDDESSQNFLKHKSKELERYADRFATKITLELMAQKAFG